MEISKLEEEMKALSVRMMECKKALHSLRMAEHKKRPEPKEEPKAEVKEEPKAEAKEEPKAEAKVEAKPVRGRKVPVKKP